MNSALGRGCWESPPGHGWVVDSGAHDDFEVGEVGGVVDVCGGFDNGAGAETGVAAGLGESKLPSWGGFGPVSPPRGGVGFVTERDGEFVSLFWKKEEPAANDGWAGTAAELSPLRANRGFDGGNPMAEGVALDCPKTVGVLGGPAPGG